MYNNFGDIFIKTLITTDYTKRKLNNIILFSITLLIRLFITMILCCVIYADIIYIDFFIYMAIYIAIVFKTKWIYYIVKKYDCETLTLTSYLIDNYTPENFRRWKKYIILTFSIYFIIYFLIFETTSTLLIIYIVQYLICYFIVDSIENKNGIMINTFNKIMDIRSCRVYRKCDMVIIEDYKEEHDMDQHNSDSIDTEEFVMFDPKNN